METRQPQQLAAVISQQVYTPSVQSGTLGNTASFQLKAKYPTVTYFSRAYNTDLQLASVSNIAGFVYGEGPKLCELTYAYGEDGCKLWIFGQLTVVFGLTAVCGDEERHLNELTNILYERFRYEKCRVFILFCGMCRARMYKISYGSVKVDAVLDAANEFFKALPGMKKGAGDGMQAAARETNRHDAWKYVTYRALFDAWRDSVFRLMHEGGIQRLRLSLVNDDEYAPAICAMRGIRALWVDDTVARYKWDNNAYEAYVSKLSDTSEYKCNLINYDNF